MGAGIGSPLVSVICNTYNHVDYIRQCLDGFLMQKTTFPIEILVHDDASIDGTADIVREYGALYPDLIKPIYQNVNQYSKGVKVTLEYQYSRAKGKYIALCEGDDYWTDPLKLQKQVDFLENNPDYVMCSHDYMEYNQKQDVLFGGLSSEENIYYDIHDLLHGKWLHHPLTVMFRSSALDLEKYGKYSRHMDAVLFFHLLRGTNKGVFLKDCMAIYRVHHGGVWSQIGLNKQRECEFATRLGICYVDQGLQDALYLKTQFSKPMSRRWMIKNRKIIFESLGIIRSRVGFRSMLKCIVKALYISLP